MACLFQRGRKNPNREFSLGTQEKFQLQSSLLEKILQTAPLKTRMTWWGYFLQCVSATLFCNPDTKPDLYFTSVKCMNGVRGQTISAWSWLPLIILAVYSILFVLIFWNMSRPDSKLCQVPRKSRLGPGGLLQLEDGGGGPFQENNLSPALSDGGVTRRIGTYIKRTAKQLSVFY